MAAHRRVAGTVLASALVDSRGGGRAEGQWLPADPPRLQVVGELPESIARLQEELAQMFSPESPPRSGGGGLAQPSFASGELVGGGRSQPSFLGLASGELDGGGRSQPSFLWKKPPTVCLIAIVG